MKSVFAAFLMGVLVITIALEFKAEVKFDRQLNTKILTCAADALSDKQLVIDKKYLCNNIRCANALVNEKILICVQR